MRAIYAQFTRNFGESFHAHIAGADQAEGEPMRILMASNLYHSFLLGGGETRMYEIAGAGRMSYILK